MRATEINVGGRYHAKVNGRVVVVRVDAIREYNPFFGGMPRHRAAQLRYDVTNLSTGKHTTFKSAAKFRNAATPDHESKL